jgi:hypothetical protein
MNNNTSAAHVWYFPSKGLKAIFDHEIVGQLSDGAWENSTPFNHYRFWCHLDTQVGPDWSFVPNVNVPWDYRRPTKKTSYNLSILVGEVCDLSYRMRAQYVNAEMDLGLKDSEPENFVDYNGNVRDANDIRETLQGSAFWNERLARLEALGIEETCRKMKEGMDRYSRKDLIKDLKLIKRQMGLVIVLANN